MSNSRHGKYRYRVVGITYVLLVILAFITVFLVPRGGVEIEVSNYSFSEAELRFWGKSVSLEVKTVENISESRVRIEYPKNNKPYIVRKGGSVEINCGDKARITIELAKTTKTLELHAENLSLSALLVGAESSIVVDSDACVCEIQALGGNYSLEIRADVAIVLVNGNDIGLEGTINIDVGELMLNLITRFGGEISYSLNSGEVRFLLRGFRRDGSNNHGRIFASGMGIDLDVFIDTGKASFIVGKVE